MSLNKRKIGLFIGKLLLVFGIFVIQGYRTSGTHTLTVKITRLKHKRGVVEIGLYEKGTNWPKVGKQFKKARVKVSGNTATYQFKGLKNGDYAIATYHDENGDKCCNKNMFGVPTEAYAFSNNIRPFLSAPKFNSCRFWVTEDRTLYIRMVY
ncbi:MAG: DUF2141 domain-containing protein [Crocinitomicaceae bacterium]|nr:DUF2141 domain-containing protein [Crocinitomicaceae bacterium]